ncbi:MAG: molecular chaperone DnaJ [Pseudomonadota bacterium]|nr:molecular chaperone DnaJ [Pseudomonadota bacterium]
MMFRLLALLLLPVMAFFAAKSISQKFSLTARQNQVLFLIMAALLIVAVLVAMGRLPVQFILAPLGGLGAFLIRFLPTLMRLLPFWQMLMSRRAASQTKRGGQTSTIRTEFLEMVLDHDSGEMSGTVLTGQHKGQHLNDMTLEALLGLLLECQADSDSQQILEAYLDRHQENWREQASATSRVFSSDAEAPMTRQLALEILGLTDAAREADIIRAHREMMRRLHPDRGGSDYLAKKINAAKDYLIG